MKLTIKSIPQFFGFPVHWEVNFNGERKIFPTHAGAVTHANKIWKRYYKEQAAISMILKISANLLCVKDKEFVSKLSKQGAVGITPKQYGYLKGIFERQERVW